MKCATHFFVFIVGKLGTFESYIPGNKEEIY